MKAALSRIIIPMAAISFFLNLVWENIQAPLYEGYEGFVQHFLICLKATGGDMVMVFAVYAIIALIASDAYWFERMSRKHAFLAIAFGAIIGTGVELILIISHRWSYAQAMPVVPLVDLGIAPLLQMAILPLATFCLMSLYGKYAILGNKRNGRTIR